MNVLFITEIKPFPPNSGERIRSYNLIRSILDLSNHLYLVSGNHSAQEHELQGITHYKMPENKPANRWVRLSYLFTRRKALVQLMDQIIETNNIDLVFLDYNFLGQYIGLLKRKQLKVVYGTHNIQSRLNYQVPGKSITDFAFRNLRYLFEKIHELYFFRKADAIIAVSEEDLAFYNKWLHPARNFLIPNFAHAADYENEHVAQKKQQVIMSGNYLAFQNAFGLKWFLENVWDEELAALAKFIIVGHGSKESLNEFDKVHGKPTNVEAIGSVQNMKKYISESKIAVIPLLHGSGTRLKCIEAMALKTNIIATSIGVEGIQHEGSIQVADTPQGFKDELLKALKDEILNEDKVYHIFLKRYSAKSIQPVLMTLLSKN